MKTASQEKMTLNVWDKALPDLGSSLGTVVETYVYDIHSEEHQHYLCIVGQVYSGKQRKENALFLSHLVEALKKEYTRNTAEPYTALTLALSRANEIAKEAQRTTFSDSSLKINMVVLSVKNGHVLFSRIAHGIVLRKRGETVELLTGKQLYSNDPFQHLTFHRINETALTPHDVIYLGTPQIFKVGEEAFSADSSSFVLPEYVTNDRPELRNIGIIAVRASETLAISASPSPEDTRPVPKKVEENTKSTRSWLKTALSILGGLAILGALIWAALPREKAQVHTEQEKSALIASVKELTEKTATLIELGNAEEAVELIEEMNQKISALETMGSPPPQLPELKEAVRYLMSQIPITSK